MKNLILAILIVLFAVSTPHAADVWYENFDSETVDQPWSNTTCGTANTIYRNSVVYHSSNCSDKIEDDVSDRSNHTTGQYLSEYCDWDTAATRNSSRRASLHISGANFDPCNELKTNDDTEYWIAWSIYIPINYYREYCSHMAGQITTDTSFVWAYYYGGDNTVGDACESNGNKGYARVRHGGSMSYPNWADEWVDHEGVWTDFVLHLVLHNTDDADAISEMWVNGNPVYSYPGVKNMPTGETKAIINLPLLYNVYNYTGTYEPPEVWIRWYDENGDTAKPEWREEHFDEFRMAEDTIGTKNYCDVAPPIWAENPSISHPSEGESNLATTFNASFTDFSPHRLDPQGCFPAYKMEVEVDEDGGDWATLIFDSGEVNSSNTISVTGLSASTTYQMRVRHSSYNSDTTTQYWGEWSTVIDFSTDLPPDPEPSLSLGGLEVGGNTAVATDGNTDLAIP